MAVAPLFWMVSMSLKETNEVFGNRSCCLSHPTLANFVYVFTQVDFIRYLWNTFLVSAVSHGRRPHCSTPWQATRSAGLRFPGRDVIFLAMFATFLISQPVIIVPLFIHRA